MNTENIFNKIEDLENEFNKNKNNSKTMSRIIHEFRIIHGNYMIGLHRKLNNCLENNENNNNVEKLINISALSSLIYDIQKKIKKK